MGRGAGKEAVLHSFGDRGEWGREDIECSTMWFEVGRASGQNRSATGATRVENHCCIAWHGTSLAETRAVVFFGGVGTSSRSAASQRIALTIVLETRA